MKLPARWGLSIWKSAKISTPLIIGKSIKYSLKTETSCITDNFTYLAMYDVSLLTCWFLDPTFWLLRRGTDTDIDTRVDTIQSKIHVLRNATPGRAWLNTLKTDEILVTRAEW